MADDPSTKTDKPSDQEGKGTPAKEELETKAAAEQAAEEKAEATAEAPKPKPKRKPAAKKADGTAAAATGVDKDAAEAGAEGAEAPAKPKRKPAAKKTTTAKAKADDAKADDAKADDAKADDAEAKPKTTRSRAKKPAEPKAEEAKPAAKPAARPQRSRARGGDQLVTVRAHARFVRVSARKARLVADHVRGKSVQEARSILAFSPRSVAEDWRKVLESAIANAEHNHDLVGDDLRVLNATADEGPTLKRFRPRAMGRATRIRKRTSHLTITLTPKD